MERPLTGGDVSTTPVAIIDGGGEPWERLGVAIVRRMEQLGTGEVLEVVSDERRARADVPVWCYLAGYELLWMAVENETARFWIRKRQKTEVQLSIPAVSFPLTYNRRGVLHTPDPLQRRLPSETI